MSDQTTTGPAASSTAPPPAVPAPKPPSRVGRFARAALRWLTALAFIFGLGVGVTWFFRVRPESEQLRRQASELTAAQAKITQLQKQADALASAQTQVASLQGGMGLADQHVELLRAWVDVADARAELADPATAAAARPALDRADAHLSSLQGRVTLEGAAAVKSMRERLALAMGELDTSPFAAQKDLEVLEGSLADLEKTLFKD